MGLLVFYAVLAAVGLSAWFGYVRPRLATYQRTAGVIKELNARELSTWGWLKLKLQGLKTAIGLGMISLYTTVHTDLLHLLGVDPSALAPFQNSSLWQTLVGDASAKITGVVTFVMALLVFHKQVKDVQVVPQVPPVVVPPGGTVQPGASPQ